MKYAFTGKGGTGKSTIAAIISHYFANDGFEVIAIDADPDANFGLSIGLPAEEAESVIPISEQRKLIKERTGANPREFGQLFRMNPEVKDIPDKFCINFRGIKLLVMGAVRRGGEGCACPENVLLRSLLSEIVLRRNEVVIIDMEAGIEHLGRATAGNVDIMIIIVEPGIQSINTARKIINYGKEIGIKKFGIVGNKIQGNDHELWIRNQFDKKDLLGFISYSNVIRDADILQKPLIDVLDRKLEKEFEIIYKSLLRDSQISMDM